MWNQQTLEQYIRDQIQEGHKLEYKGARSLAKTDDKTREITKDISAMANASGGITIYGIKEFDQAEKRHLPERIEPIDRMQFSKEWLEHIIGNIHPKIPGLIIHPVDLDTDANHTAYVVEVPQSTTAHQATDVNIPFLVPNISRENRHPN